MRSPLEVSALLLLALAALILCAWPVVALFCFESSSARVLTPILPSFEGEAHSALALFFLSVAWAGGTAGIATLCAWPIGRWIGNAMASGASGCASFALVVLCASTALPPWLLYFSLWTMCAPGSMLGDLAAQHDAVGTLRIGLLVTSLVLWATAPAAVIVAVFRSGGDGRATMLERVDGWGRLRRWRAAWSRDVPVLAAGFAFVSLTLVGETVVFDLAQVVTYGFELRTLDATGAPAAQVFVAGLPAILLALIGGFALLRCLSQLVRPSVRLAVPAIPSRFTRASVCVVAALPMLPSLFVLAQGLEWQSWQRFASLHGSQAVSMLIVSLASAAGGACLASATALLALRGGSNERWAKLSTLLLLTLAVTPATVVALLLEAACNRPELAYGIGAVAVSVYDSPCIVVLGLIARTGGWAALAGVLVGIGFGTRARMLAQLDGPSLLAAWRSSRRVTLVAGAIGGVLAFAGSLAELGTTSRLAPPAFDSLATSILNAIHYQRPETVLLSMVFLLASAVLVGVLTVGVSTRFRRVRGMSILLLAALVPFTLVACGGGDSSLGALKVEQSVGCVGRGAGQFVFPRVLASDPRTGDFYVIDKDARVQRFSEDGAFLNQWRMPDWATGKPTGASVAPTGELVVADTHYYRIIAFTPEGIERWRFGKYGLEEGSFIYPTDIAFGEDGEMFVSEYGSNDRVQVFDARGNFLRSFGSFGSDAGQFARPQSLVWDATRRELFVADSVNGRVQVFDREGKLKRILASGALVYPYGLDLLADGSLAVSELGAHRVQWVDADTGETLARAGSRGFARGQLQYPWALAARRDGSVAVLDSGNNRVEFALAP